MPSFDVCYLNADGSLACTLAAVCVDETQAKILAHAMKLSRHKRFEVWSGDKLVYERPDQWRDDRSRRAPNGRCDAFTNALASAR